MIPEPEVTEDMLMRISEDEYRIELVKSIASRKSSPWGANQLALFVHG